MLEDCEVESLQQTLDFPVRIYLLKVNNRNNKTRCEEDFQN